MSYPSLFFIHCIYREDEMKRSGLAQIAVLALFLGISGTSAVAQSGANSSRDLFKARCALCHGENGQGKTTLGQQMKAFDLNSAKVQSQTNTALKQVILEGKGNMPPFQAQLTSEQIAQLLKYVRTFGKKH